MQNIPFYNLIDFYKIKIGEIQMFPYLTDPNSYIGAFVKDPTIDGNVNIEKDVVDLDARSLYPTIMLNSNISPENLLFLIPEKIISAYFIIKDLFIKNEKYNNNDINSFTSFLKENKELLDDYIKFINENFNEILVFSFIKLDNTVIDIWKKMFKIDIKIIDNNLFIKFNDPISILLWIYLVIDKNKHCITMLGLIFDSSKTGIISKILIPLIYNRKKIKLQMKEETDESKIRGLKILDWAYKLLANSLYGLFGFSGSWLYNILMASSITITGQWFIKYVSKKYNDEFIDDIS